MTVCLDSWAVLAWLIGEEPALRRVNRAMVGRPTMSWINLVEVSYRTERLHGRGAAEAVISRLRTDLELDLPGTARMLEAGRLKARYRMALADCFAVATAAAAGAELWTGDPEIIDAPDLPCRVVDLRR